MGNLAATQNEMARYFCRTSRQVRDWASEGAPIGSTGPYDLAAVTDWLRRAKPRAWKAIRQDKERRIDGPGGAVVGIAAPGEYVLYADQVAEVCSSILDPDGNLDGDAHRRGVLSGWFPGVRFYGRQTNVTDLFEEIAEK
jgi:hypothetical protein